MPIRQFKPVTASSRFRSVADFSEITRTTPEKSLTEPLKKSGGRDNHGHISMRRRGGGEKRKYRIIDFKRNKHGREPATVRHIEYDPNRSARIALVEYADGEKRYILHPKGLAVGDTVVSGPGSDVRRGQRDAAARGAVGHRGAQRGAQARQGWADGPLRRHERPGRREGGRVRHAAHGVDGDAPRARTLPGARSAKSATPSTSSCRGARPARRAGWGVARRCAAR